MKDDKKIPFLLDRSDKRTLVRQIVEGFREAIVGGYYVTGDVLPSIRELAPMLGVSEIVTKAAVKQLGEDGFVVSRPRLGTVVRNRTERQWRGHVVLVQQHSDSNYLQAVLAENLREMLIDAGWLFSQVTVKRGERGRYDFSPLDAVLSRSADLVIVVYEWPEAFSYLAKKGVQFAAFAGVEKPPKGAVGLTRIDYNMAVPGFVAECVRLGVKNIVEIYFSDRMSHTASAFDGTDIVVERMHAPGDLSHGVLEGVRRAGFDVFSRLVAENRLERDAVYFIADDYLATGALMALACSGLRAPEDVRLAVWSNVGISNVYSRELSRMEMNPAEAGRHAAAAALEYLKTGAYPSCTIGPKWISGETM